MAEVFKFREIQALFTARLPDSADSDQLPDRVPLNGYGTLRPNIRGTSVVFTEVGEFAVPRTRQVAFVDGELMVEVVDGESSILQPLFLEVTVDERANQQWSWTLTFDSLTIGAWGEEISHPALSFPVENGDGPLELSTVATTVTRTANFVSRGAPGAGLQEITAVDGEIVFAWDNGRTTAIGVPDAVPGPPGDKGVPGVKGDPGDVRFEGIDPGITVRTDDVLIGDTSVAATGYVHQLDDVQKSPFVSTDTDGAPYWDPESGTHRVMLDADGVPVFIPRNAPLLSEGTSGPELAFAPHRGAHNHDDRYYTKSQSDARTPKSHNHDDRYYTRDQTDDLVAVGGAFTRQDAGLMHRVQRDVFTRRRGGVIGTSGLPAVALRFDHGLVNFRDKVLPHMIRLGLPGSIAMNSEQRRWDLTENAGVTPADLDTWAVEYGIEVWNHGQTHGDADTLEGLHREIVTGKAELQAQTPSVPVEGWIIPGVGGTRYDGFAAGGSPADWDTTAGRLILAHHGASTSNSDGWSSPLSGDQTIIGRHYGVDNADFASMKAEMDDLVSSGLGGAVIFLHPSLLDNGTNITTADYVEALEYIAAQRDAGKLVVLTMGGMSVADQGREHRPTYAPLLDPMDSPAPLPVSSAKPFGYRRRWAMGAAREILIDLDLTTAGTVTVKVGTGQPIEYTLNAGPQRIIRPCTVPLDRTTLNVTVTPGTAAGTVTQILDYPI